MQYKKGQKVSGEFMVWSVVSYEDFNRHANRTMFYRMVLLVHVETGELVQWFGKPDTKFWQDNFSSRLDSPLREGSTVKVQGFVKVVKPEDEHYPERVVVQRPSVV